MNRWPVRQGAALGMGVMIVLGIASVVLINGSTAGTLQSGHVAEGMYVYEEFCASCHGIYGEGTLDGPPVVGEGFAHGNRQGSGGYLSAIRIGEAKPISRSDFHTLPHRVVLTEPTFAESVNRQNSDRTARLDLQAVQNIRRTVRAAVVDRD